MIGNTQNGLTLQIQNKQVEQIYERWNGVWKNTNHTLETRLKAYSILQVIEATVAIYEGHEKLDEEEVDDLFIAWSERLKPVFPEDIVKLRNQLKKSNKT